MIVNADRPGVSVEETQPEDKAATAKKRGGGPRTPEGKERCKRNALKHAMLAEHLLTEELATVVAVRTLEFVAEFVPSTPYETWLVGQIALATAKLDHLENLMIVDHQRG